MGGVIVVGGIGDTVGRRLDGRFSMDIKLTVVKGRCVTVVVASSVVGLIFCFFVLFVVDAVVDGVAVVFFFVVVVEADFVGCDDDDDGDNDEDDEMNATEDMLGSRFVDV